MTNFVFGVITSFDAVPEFLDYVSDLSVIVSEKRIPDNENNQFQWNLPGTTLKDEDRKKYSRCVTDKNVRLIQDDFLTESEVITLLDMMKKGMQASTKTVEEGGPTILDINSGYMKDAQGLVNIYTTHRGQPRIKFDAKEYGMYRTLFTRVKSKIMEVFEVDELYFTAPTFVARIIGNQDWKPLEIHDEYYHALVDKFNSPHYFYSGLVYLSDYGTDFTGGEFLFLDEKGNDNKTFIATAVLPRRGRFITFKSGPESLHKVNKVLNGTRYTLSMWFTCDAQHEFGTFLDGGVHREFKKPARSENDDL